MGSKNRHHDEALFGDPLHVRLITPFTFLSRLTSEAKDNLAYLAYVLRQVGTSGALGRDQRARKKESGKQEMLFDCRRLW